MVNMKRQEFIQETRESADLAVQRSNAYLERIGLSLTVNWDYDSWEENGLDNAIGAYESESVFSGEISIAFNMRNLRKWLATAEKDNPWSDPYKMLDEAIQTNVFHEMGHGIVQLIDDYLQNTDELDGIYDQNQELFDYILDNEEDAVEEFAWDVYDNQPEDSRLGQIVDLYVNLWDTDGQGDDDRMPEIVGEGKMTANKKRTRLTEGNLKRIVNESVKRVLNEEFGWNEEIFRDDMRGYIMANRDYDGSVSAANGRHSILKSVYGDLPWEVSQYDFFNQVIMRLSYGPNIDDQVEFAVNWVKNKFNGRRR